MDKKHSSCTFMIPVVNPYKIHAFSCYIPKLHIEQFKYSSAFLNESHYFFKGDLPHQFVHGMIMTISLVSQFSLLNKIMGHRDRVIFVLFLVTITLHNKY